MLFFLTPEKPICAHKLHFNRGNDFPEGWAEREGAASNLMPTTIHIVYLHPNLVLARVNKATEQKL